METTVQTHVGQPVEITLPHMDWALTLHDPDQILRSRAPQGVYDEQRQVVIWAFDAVKVGTATLLLTGKPRMQPGGYMRSHLVIAHEYVVQVQD